jgi:hypothetical protein
MLTAGGQWVNRGQTLGVSVALCGQNQFFPYSPGGEMDIVIVVFFG